jgi:outer membrane protein
VAYAAPIVIERLFIKPSIGVSYISSNLADYYYGVKSSEARPGRPSYDVGDTWGWSAGVVSNYRIHENWLLMFLLEYEGFSDDVKDSPIVSEDGEFNLMLGAAWNF